VAEEATEGHCFSLVEGRGGGMGGGEDYGGVYLLLVGESEIVHSKRV
jgi:hypothetical protein